MWLGGLWRHWPMRYHLRMEEPKTRAEQIQEEVQEIAEVLARWEGKELRAVWNEALTLHRVRYETEVLPPIEKRDQHP